MIKLAVFDLDNTLAPLGKGISERDLFLLSEIEKRGIRIAVCSGKPCYYLCGFMRQVGLNAPILVGENGATIVFGVDLPPKEHYTLPYSTAAKQSICLLRQRLDKRLPDMWYQPNEVALTPFPVGEEEFAAVQRIIDECGDLLLDLAVYRHNDSFDILPTGIDKQRGLAYLAGLLDITPAQIVAVGDGVNDYPMFEYASCALGINVADSSKVHRNFTSVTDALHYILEIEELKI